jgi:hypothetical protein
MALEKRA